MVGRRFRVAGLVLAVSVFAACGASDAPSVAGPKLQLSSSSPSGSGAAAAEQVGFDAKMSSWVEYRYELVPGSYPEGSVRPGYRVVSKLPTKEQVADLAASLGFEGVEPMLNADGTVWEVHAGQISTAGGSSSYGELDVDGPDVLGGVVSDRTLMVDQSGFWWFTDNTVPYPSWVCDDVDGVCELDESSVLPVDEAAADERAAEVFASGGAGEGVTSSSLLDGMYTVRFTESIDGVLSDGMWSVTFIGDEIASADGSFVEFELLGDYVTVGAAEAANRLGDYRWSQPVYGVPSVGPAAMSAQFGEAVEDLPVDSGVVGFAPDEGDSGNVVSNAPVGAVLSSSPVGSTEGPDVVQVSVCGPLDGSGAVKLPPPPTSDVVVEPLPADQLPAEPIPTDLMPVDPEVVTVTLSVVEEAFVTWWSGDQMYMLPGYRMGDGVDVHVVVLAVEDDAVEFVDEVLDETLEPAVIDPAVIDPASEPVVGGLSGSSESSSGDVAVSDTVPVDEPLVAPDVACLVGLSEVDAQRQVELSGFTFRVVARDGEQFAVTMDYRLDRVNVVVVDGSVSEASVG